MAAPKRAPAPDARRDMEKELAAAAALKYQLGEAFGDDHDVTLIRDMIEGSVSMARSKICVASTECFVASPLSRQVSIRSNSGIGLSPGM
ncbi:hypothetical protein [Bradyrhizobium sp. Ai1a-2]|uniref:hypothetical protein n=1 Tax=Bradyrhizobium sp. Ai1a-2 TaxID=196490 RepID=UPI00048A13C4|nr:hypothetical protein [Bradyrhizobium sp. Ai1a-2]